MGSYEEQKLREIVMNFKFSVSDANLVPGEVQIKLPRYLFEDRDGKLTGEIDYNTIPFVIKGKEGGNTVFTYEKKEDHILLTNRDPIIGAYSADAVIRYNYDPLYVESGKKIELKLEYNLENSEFISDTLTATNITNTSFLKNDPQNKLIKKGILNKNEIWDPKWGQEPENSEEYFYTQWYLSLVYENNTQKVKIDIEPNISNGTLVGYSLNNDAKLIMTNGENKISEIPSKYSYMAGPQSIYVVFKHRKEDVKNNPELVIKNTDKIILNGIDTNFQNNSYDEITLESEYKYEPLPKINSLGRLKSRKFNSSSYVVSSLNSGKIYNTNMILNGKNVPVIYGIYHNNEYFNNNDDKGFITSITESKPLEIRKFNGNNIIFEELRPGIDYFYSEVNFTEMKVQDILHFPNWGDKLSWSGKSEDVGVAEISIKTLDNPEWEIIDKVKMKTKERNYSYPEKKNELRYGYVEFERDNIKFGKEATEVKN